MSERRAPGRIAGLSRIIPIRRATKAVRRLLQHSALGRRALTEVHVLRGLRAIQASGAFDQRFYELQARQVFRGRRAAVRHYLRHGRVADLSPHPLYEPGAHVRDRSKRRHGRVSPFALFLAQSRMPRVRPHHLFDVPRYLADHPEAAWHRLGAWGHFLDRAAADPTLPLPLSPLLPEVALPYGRFVADQYRHATRWAEQEAVAAPARLSDHHDVAAEKRLLAELTRYPQPPRTDPLVSVITTVRNRPHHILEAIASVLAQTFTRWELIVVDDGSDDATPDVVEEVARHDRRIRLLRLPHAGVSAARNSGAAVARGRYVAWLDSDNTWQPRFLEVMLRAMTGRAARAAYCACTFNTAKGVRYREFVGGLEHLAIGNFVDLNVLMVERSLLDEIGGFDPSLPRAVDYDLVYRIAQRVELSYVPFLGTDYADDADDPHRISVKELRTWNYVVRDRHTTEWDRLVRLLDRRVPGRVSVVVAGRERWDDIWASVLRVLRTVGPDEDVEVVVVDGGSRRAASLLIAAAELFDPRVRVLRSPVNLNRAGNANLGLADTTGEFVVLISPSVLVDDDWLPPLLGALADPQVLAAAPVLLDDEGTVAAAGVILPKAVAVPTPFLRGRPAAEVKVLGRPQPVPALGRGVLAVRAADVVPLHGYDPLFIDAFEEADLCLRLLHERPDGRVVVVPESTASYPPYLTFGLGEENPGNRRLFTRRWADRADDRADLWALTGQLLRGYRTDTITVAGRRHGADHQVTLVTAVLEAQLPGASEGLPGIDHATNSPVEDRVRSASRRL